MTSASAATPSTSTSTAFAARARSSRATRRAASHRAGSTSAAPPSAPAIAPRESAIARLRELALTGADRDDAEYATAIEAAIAAGDAPALAYELGRLDASGEGGLPADLVASALRRLGALPVLIRGTSRT